VFILLLATSLLACKKENQKNLNTGIKEQPFTENVKSENGILIFENEAHLLNELEVLSELTFEEKLEFENKLNFRSLNTIKQLINNAEIKHQEEFYQGIDPNLRIEEYESMGLYYDNTAIFKENLDKEVIEIIYEKDGSSSFELTVKSPGFDCVLNENGEVIVGENVFKFHTFFLTITNRNNNQILNIINMAQASEKMVSNWSQGGTWMYDGSTKRYNYRVYGTCITSSNETPGGTIQSSFYVQALGQYKKFGTWAARSSYLPVCSFSGNWTASYTAQQCFTCPIETNPISLIDYDNQSPFSWSSTSGGGVTNNFLRYLKPNGSWTLPSPWLFETAFNVNYNMIFNFSGGASGFSHTLSK
jgi:hypothetical protein